MAKRLFNIRAAFVSALLIAIGGCGYHIAGKGGAMPGGVKSVSIPVFNNTTAKPDIESVLTSAFVNEFVTTVEVKEKSDAVMRVTIKSYTLTPVSYTGSDVSQEYRLTVVLAARLYRQGDGATGEILWSDENIVDSEDFTVNIMDVAATKDRETEALKKLARDTARLIKERMLEDF